MNINDLVSAAVAATARIEEESRAMEDLLDRTGVGHEDVHVLHMRQQRHLGRMISAQTKLLGDIVVYLAAEKGLHAPHLELVRDDPDPS